MKAIIVGAGIGGLATALFLHKHGLDCEVYERASAVRELGVGINLLPHAVGTLAEVELLEALRAVAMEPDELIYRTRWGQSVWQEPRGLAAGLPFPQLSIHRGRLLGVLYDAVRQRLPEGTVRTDARFTGLREREDAVVASFARADGSTLEGEGDFVVGADGIHSAMRALLYPDEGKPRWSGRVIWRGLTDWPAFADGRGFTIAGSNDCRVVLFPLGPGRADGTLETNWVAAVRVAEDGAPLPTKEDWQSRAVRQECVRVLAQVSLPELDLAALAEATPDIWEFPMLDREPLPRWSFGKVTLLGDAAHPMYPFGGNGSAQAILDAKALAEALAREGSAVAGLAAYDAARREPVAKIVLSNRQGGPERVIDAVEARADGEVADLEALVPFAERQAIVRGYTKLAGFTKEQLSAA